mgnify:CR=1 FL=1
MRLKVIYIIDSYMDKMAITPKGLKLLLAGAIVMAAGYILMMGGGSDDPQVFNYAMFDARRLVAAPLVILAGIVVIVVAIIGEFKGKNSKEEK